MKGDDKNSVWFDWSGNFCFTNFSIVFSISLSSWGWDNISKYRKVNPCGFIEWFHCFVYTASFNPFPDEFSKVELPNSYKKNCQCLNLLKQFTKSTFQDEENEWSLYRVSTAGSNRVKTFLVSMKWMAGWGLKSTDLNELCWLELMMAGSVTHHRCVRELVCVVWATKHTCETLSYPVSR